jgi:SAM-dependent methyltransferase
MNSNTQEQLADLYARRFPGEEREQKESVWRVLCQAFFQKYVSPDSVVLDVGAGYCEFINNIACKTKLAVDLNQETRSFAAPDVQVIETAVDDLSPLSTASADVAFCSNVYEHLHSTEELLRSLHEALRVLRPGGKFLILMPNIHYAYREYWDFLDHHLPLSHRSLVEALRLCGFNIAEVRPRFLPFSTKSRFPKTALLVWLYLKLRPVHALLGKQMFIVATKPA